MCARRWPSAPRSALRRPKTWRPRSRAGKLCCSRFSVRSAVCRVNALCVAHRATATEAFAFHGAPHNLPRVKNGWEIVSRKTYFDEKNVEVVQEKIRSPARSEPRRWTVVRRKRAVVVAPITADGKLILIRQERIPIRQAIWEVPAGQIDDKSESEPRSEETTAE